MKRASISETKKNLSALIDRMKNGEAVMITDRGRPVARLQPIGSSESEDERIAWLQRAGVLRPPKDKSGIDYILSTPPIRLKSGASVLQALLDERAEAER